MTFTRILVCAALLAIVGCGKEEKGQENPEVPKPVLKEGSDSPEGMGDPAQENKKTTPETEKPPVPAPTPKENGEPTPAPTPKENGEPTPAPTPGVAPIPEDPNAEGPTLAPPKTNSEPEKQP